MRGLLPATLARDVPASIVVFLVAMPLCMGIAIASGVPPEKGLITGIVGGTIVGFLSGSPLQISGPAAGLAVIVFAFALTGIYVARANSRFDDLTSRLEKDLV